jgi:hypothetical protein
MNRAAWRWLSLQSRGILTLQITLMKKKLAWVKVAVANEKIQNLHAVYDAARRTFNPLANLCNTKTKDLE